MIPSELLAAPAGSGLVRFARDDDRVTIFIAMAASTAPCPDCRSDAHRVHSRYMRRLADLPCFGTPVRLELTVRRFRCSSPECPRRISVERLPGFAAKHARTTDRLRRSHEAIGFRWAESPAPVSPCSSPCPPAPIHCSAESSSSRAYRGLHRVSWGSTTGRGARGTATAPSSWIWNEATSSTSCPTAMRTRWRRGSKAHPEVEVVSRDRSSAYAQAATDCAPQATQVADRWHLLKNLREAVERLFERHSSVVAEALKGIPLPPEPSSAAAATTPTAPEEEVGPSSNEPPAGTILESPRRQAQRARRERRVERFEQVRERHQQGHSARRIAQDLGLSCCTVRLTREAARAPTGNQGGLACQGSTSTATGSTLAWPRETRTQWTCTDDWLNEGIEALTGACGGTSRSGSVRRGGRRARVNAAKPPTPPPPSPKRLSFEWVRRPENREPEQQARLDAIRGSSAEVASGLDLADEFAGLIRNRPGGDLAAWLTKGESSACPELRQFAAGVRGDEAAVTGAVNERWSNGPVEGHVNRLKAIKRQMYGRAGFLLLRSRVRRAA